MGQFLHQTGLRLLSSAQTTAFVCLAAALLPFIGLPFLWVGTVVMALYTLKHGWRASLFPLGAMILPGVCFSLTAGSLMWLQVLVPVLMVYAMAVMLQRANAWSLVIEVGVLIGVVMVCLIHLLVPDIGAWWSQIMTKVFQNTSLAKLMGLGKDTHLVNLQTFARFATGFQISGDLLLSGLNVLIASSWMRGLTGQRKQHNSWKKTSLSWTLLGLVGLLMMGALLGWPVAQDALPVPLIAVALVGFATLQALCARSRRSVKTWLLIVLTVIFSPYSLIALAVLAISDRFVNWRAQLRG